MGFGHEGDVAVPQAEASSLAAKFEGQAGRIHPSRRRFSEDGKDLGKVLENFHLPFALGGVKKFSHHQVQAADAPGIHQAIHH
jgi:hypothetical protein